jgi:3'-phosphoadenosine 5'-phosphosulfate sulfotransferase (PAPS reductase)/FAD synthetase
MRKYLSFGGGVNSVALHLMLLEQGDDFESVFVHHGTDWPETYDYVAGFQWWLKKNGHRPITILFPSRKYPRSEERTSSLYDFCMNRGMFPSRLLRWCTSDFKTTPFEKYQETPCFVLIGFDYGERKRAKIYSNKGAEFRYPLIEQEITRQGCIEIIKSYGLPVPPKSGCFICPFMRKGQVKDMRRYNPELFCKLEQLEENNNHERKKRGLKPYYSWGCPVRGVVGENQMQLFEQDEYPPCECEL